MYSEGFFPVCSERAATFNNGTVNIYGGLSSLPYSDGGEGNGEGGKGKGKGKGRRKRMGIWSWSGAAGLSRTLLCVAGVMHL